MNTLIAGLITAVGLAISLPATAQHRHGHHNGHQIRNHVPHVVHHHHYNRVHRHRMERHWHPHHGWIWAPVIVGGAYLLHQNTRPAPFVTEEIISPAVTPTNPAVECTEWREIQSQDGKVYRERTCKELPQ